MIKNMIDLDFGVSFFNFRLGTSNMWLEREEGSGNPGVAVPSLFVTL